MHRNLIKLYFTLLIALILFISLFPSIFININNIKDFAIIKTLISLGNKDVEKTNIYKDKGNVIVMFDDGWKTQYEIAYKYMNQKKMRGSVAVIPSLVGEYGYMNKGELYHLHYENWDLLNHTYSHIFLPDNNIDKQMENIRSADDWLERNGFIDRNRILIYPEGEYDNNTVRVMERLKYTSGRTTMDGFNPKKPPDLYNIKVKNVFSNIEPKEVTQWIDYTIINNNTLILLFHKIEDDIDE